jgi:predicted secreted protein
MKAALACCLLILVALAPVGASLTAGESALCKDVALRTGQELHLALAANPTTGYKWNCTWTPPRCLKMTRDEYVAAPSGGAVGTGGTHHYTLVAVEPGDCRVDLRYARPWTGGEAETPRSLHVLISGTTGDAGGAPTGLCILASAPAPGTPHPLPPLPARGAGERGFRGNTA